MAPSPHAHPGRRASFSRHERHALHRASGMHSPNAELRTDNDAFEVRADVSVEDACFTSLRLVRMAVAQLELLGTSADLDAAHRDAVDGIACLARLACGTLGIAHGALCDEPPPATT
jgi:hypothetical protein